MRPLLLILALSACAPDREPSTFAQDAAAAKDYDFALCLPMNYAPSDRVFSAHVQAIYHGNLVYARRIEFTSIELQAWPTHCAVVAGASPDGNYTVQFEEELARDPQLVVVFHPANLSLPMSDWAGLSEMTNGEQVELSPYVARVSATDGYYQFAMIGVTDYDGHGPVLTARPMRHGETILLR
jgi:hypothetical protein